MSKSPDSVKKSRKKLCIISAIAAAGLLLAAGLVIFLKQNKKLETLELTRQGEPNGVIAIPENASQLEEYAARELADHVKLVSGATISIVNGEPDTKAMKKDEVMICLATPESYNELSKRYADDLAFLAGSDGFAVRQKGNIIYIFGENAGGTLNGVYDFIESNLGVLWTRAIKLGTLYDPMPTITAQKVDYREKSPFNIRGWHLCGFGPEGQAHSDPGTEIMLSRNKLNGKFAEFGNLAFWDWQKSIGIEPVNLGHSLHHWLRTSLYYQGLEKERQDACWNTDGLGNPIEGFGHLNFWNPDVAIAIADSLNAFLEERDINYIGVGIEDTADFKQVPEEREPFEYAPGQFVQPGDEKFLSTVFYAFMNDVARMVRAEHPEAKLTTFAYLFTETPPYIELEENITIVIAPIFEDMKYSVADDSCYRNSLIKDNMLEWEKSTKNVFVYNYYGCYPNAHDDFERPISKRIQEDLRFYRELGFTGLLPEGHVDNEVDLWAVGTLTMWLYSKLAWNPDADIEALTRHFCEKAYGAAAEDMFLYYHLLQETWDNNAAPVSKLTGRDNPVSWNTPTTYFVKYFYGDKAHNALMGDALIRAWEKADDLQKQRIEPIKKAFEKFAKR